MAAKKTPTSKKSAAKKSASKKSVVSKKPASKSAASKPAVKAALKKTAVKKTAAPTPKKAAVKKTAAKKLAVKKSAAKKTSLKSAPVKKAAALKRAVERAIVKKTAARKSPARAVAVKKVASKKTASKPTAVTAKAASAKQASIKKALIKKTPIKKTAAPGGVRKTSVATKKALSKKAPPPTLAANPALKLPNARRRGPQVPPSKLASIAKARVRQNPVQIVPPPVKLVVAPSTKAQKAAKNIAKPMAGTRGSLRSSTLSKKSARSPARGLPPLPLVPASASDAKMRETKLADQPLSEQKLREHIRTSLCYLEAWLHSGGADVTPATTEMSGPAEAARAQIWRWLDREAAFDDGRQINTLLFEELLNCELVALRGEIGTEAFDAGLYVTAAELFLNLAVAPDFNDFPGASAQAQSLADH